MSTTSAVQSFVVSPQNNNMSAGSSSSSSAVIIADQDQTCFDDLSGAFNYHIHDDGDDLRHTLSLSHFEDAFSSWPIFPNLTPLAYVPPHPTPLLLLDPTPPTTTTTTINSSRTEPENSIPNEQNNANNADDDNNNIKKDHDNDKNRNNNNNNNNSNNSADDSSSYLLPAPFGRSDSVHTVVEAMATSLSPVANKQRHADESSMYFEHPQMKKHLLPINQQNEIEEHHEMKKQKLMMMPSSIYLEPINQFPISNFQQPQQQRAPLLVNTSSSHAMTFNKCALESSKLQPTSPSGSSVASTSSSSSSSSCFSDICEQPVQQQQQQQKIPPKQGNGRIRKRVSLSSPFRGVSRCGKDHKYQARIRDGQKVHYLGRFNDEIVAAIRYDEASRNFKNIGASTNFTDEIWKSPELLQRIMSVGNIQTHVPEWIFPYLTASVRQKLLNKISKNSLCLIPSSVQLQKDLKKSSCV